MRWFLDAIRSMAPGHIRDRNEKVCGRVTLRVIEDDKVISVQKRNLIVNGMKPVLAHLSSEADAQYQVANFSAGSGTTAPAVGNTGLESLQFGPKAIASHSFPGSPSETSVLYYFTMEKAEGNGGGTVDYAELGLFTTNGIMVSRVTFDPIQKNVNRKFEFEWEHLF